MRTLLGFGLVTVAALAAVAANQPVTTDLLWDMRSVGDPQITDDGRSVIYVLGSNDKMTDQRHSNLWIATADGKDNRPITTGAYRDSSPRLSPDGARIAYLSNRSGKTQIHVRWLDTGQEAQVTDLQQAPSAIEWSPDGKGIGYVARVPGKPEWSIRMPERPAGAKWADPPIVVTRLRWRQDGQGLIPPGFMHAFVIPATGGAPRQVTSGEYNHSGGFAWSRDGRSIYVSVSRIPDAEYSLEGPDLWAYSVADGTPKQLTHRSGTEANPEPSPGGSKIAYLGHDWKFQSYTVNHLYVMDADGSNARDLTPKLDRDVRSPHWSWDGRTLYFLVDERGTTQLYSIALETGELKPLTSGMHQLGSGGGGGGGGAEGFTVARNGVVATTRSTSKEPSDVVVFAAHRPADRTRLTAVNDSLFAGRMLGEAEEITYTSFDGRTIQGWIIKPPNFDAEHHEAAVRLDLELRGETHSVHRVRPAMDVEDERIFLRSCA